MLQFTKVTLEDLNENENITELAMLVKMTDVAASKYKPKHEFTSDISNDKLELAVKIQ